MNVLTRNLNQLADTESVFSGVLWRSSVYKALLLGCSSHVQHFKGKSETLTVLRSSVLKPSQLWVKVIRLTRQVCKGRTWVILSTVNSWSSRCPRFSIFSWTLLSSPGGLLCIFSPQLILAEENSDPAAIKHGWHLFQQACNRGFFTAHVRVQGQKNASNIHTENGWL